MQLDDVEYVGFWLRVLASIIDTVLMLIVIFPILMVMFGVDFVGSQSVLGPIANLLSWILPPVAVIIFWVTKQATPGKMAISAKVVDVETGASLTVKQSIGRYLSYYLAAIPFCLGFLWVAFDIRKQGWHDKLAGTVVIRNRR